MAISFSKVKKSLGLYDYLTFGKFAMCRVDSIIEDNYEYLIYLSKQGLKFDQEVLDILKNKFSKPTKDDVSYYQEAEYEAWFIDIPF